MELNITTLVNGIEPTDFSNSIANSGLQNIGEITWRNACEYFEDHDLLVGSENREDLEDWIRDFGAWDRDEIKGWTDIEINALLLQFIAGDLSEYQDAEDRGDLEDYLENQGGRLYQGDDGSWYFYVGC